MEVTVLGKRNRSIVDDVPSHSTRSKRRSLRHAENDENVKPSSHVESIDDCSPTSTIKLVHEKPARKSRQTAPSKHGAPERMVEISPAKINGHFKPTKASVEVYQDQKCARTPTTPRHRDALVKKIPVTPRHRVVLVGSQRSGTVDTSSQYNTSVYNLARRLFSRCSNPGRLIGRDDERDEISRFLETRMQSSSGGCLYVSGPPGTGKSALLNEVIQEGMSIKQSTINCMSVRTTRDLSQKLVEDLGLNHLHKPEDLRSSFIRNKSKDESGEKYLVILDEVDRLVDLDLDLLYRLFEWSMSPQSKLILIGIANALDLTDRFLPRLKSRGMKPDLLPFMPYSALQIAEVLTSKLRSLYTGHESQPLPLIQPAAIQFCARKVAAQTGDLRKAFDICKRAIDLVEQETREKALEDALQASPSKMVLVENINLSSPITPRPTPIKSRSTSTLTLETAPKVTIAHMAKVTAQAFSNGTTQRLHTLNLQQKAVLCALAALERKRRQNQVARDMYATPSKSHTNHTAPTIKQLFEAYCLICRRDSILHPLTSIEFRDVISGLETLSLISAADGKNGSLIASPAPTPSRTPGKKSRNALFGGTTAGTDEKRVASVVGYKELEGSLQGAGADLLRDILESDGLM